MVIELYSLPVVNKKGTKFVSARKTIPNVNLRGKYVEPYIKPLLMIIAWQYTYTSSMIILWI